MKQNCIINHISILIQLSAGITLAAMLFFTTRYGLGLSPDSIAYIKGAEGLLTGKGTDYMSVQWPPLYSLMLALFGFAVDKDLLLGARILNTFLIFINYWLITQLLIKYANINRLLACLMAFVISLHEVLVYVGFYAWSEPLVITIILIDLLIIEKYLNRKNDKDVKLECYLIIFSILSIFTRYIGVNIALINAVIVMIFIGGRLKIYTKIWRAGLQVIVPILAIYPWLAWHKAVDDNNATQRGLQWHPISTEKIINGIENIGRFLFPSSSKFDGLIPLPLLITFGVIVVLIVIATVINAGINLSNININNNYKSDQNAIKFGLLGIIGLFIIFYISFLIVTISFVDMKLLFDNRFLSPIFIPIMLLLLGLMSLLSKPIVRYACFGLFVVVMTFSYINLRSWLLINYFDGVEINSRGNINKPIYRNIRQFSKHCQIYSDKPWNISLYFDKKVSWLPTEILFGTGLINQTYKSEIESLKENTNLVVVENKDDPIINEIDLLANLELIYDGKDGLIWKNKNIDFSICESN